MRKLLAIAAFVALACPSFAADMASQKWVEMRLTNAATRAWIYATVNEAVSNSLAITKAISPLAVDAGTNGTVYAFFEPATVMTLMATNSLNSSITNGAMFAWVGNGIYTNAALGAISSTETNFVWRATPSQVADGIDTFVRPDGFGVTGLYITETQAKAIRGEE